MGKPQLVINMFIKGCVYCLLGLESLLFEVLEQGSIFFRNLAASVPDCTAPRPTLALRVVRTSPITPLRNIFVANVGTHTHTHTRNSSAVASSETSSISPPKHGHAS